MREAKQAEAKKAKQDPLMKRSKESWAEYGKRMAADHAASREASRDDRSDDDRDSDEDLEEDEDDSGGSGEEEEDAEQEEAAVGSDLSDLYGDEALLAQRREFDRLQRAAPAAKSMTPEQLKIVELSSRLEKAQRAAQQFSNKQFKGSTSGKAVSVSSSSSGGGSDASESDDDDDDDEEVDDFDKREAGDLNPSKHPSETPSRKPRSPTRRPRGCRRALTTPTTA
jgi:hypothetical protein